MAELINVIQGESFKGLIGDPSIPALTANVTLKGTNATLAAGTILALNSGKYEIVDSASETADVKVASVILKEDVILTGSDAVATVYVSGVFNRNKLLVAQSADSATAHEAELRTVGIYLTKEM